MDFANLSEDPVAVALFDKGLFLCVVNNPTSDYFLIFAA